MLQEKKDLRLSLKSLVSGNLPNAKGKEEVYRTVLYRSIAHGTRLFRILESGRDWTSVFRRINCIT